MKQSNRLLAPEKYEKRLSQLLVLAKNKQQISAEQKLIEAIGSNIDFIQHINQSLYHNNGKLLIPVKEEFEEFSFKLQELVDGMKDKFLLFVVGMGNAGKSTLINAILEQDAAEMDILPKTWKIDVFENQSDSLCEVVYKTGIIKKISVQDTKQLIQEEEDKTTISKKYIKNELKKLMPKLKSKEELKEITTTLEQKLLYKSDIIEVRWPISPTEFSQRFKIVDTPGLVQENLSGETKYSIQEYYHKADGVLWILDANKLSSAKPKELLDELKEELDNIGGSTKNIIAVINRIDFVKKQGGEKAVEKVMQKAQELFDSYFSSILPISAKEAYLGSKNEDDVIQEQSGIYSLLKQIDSQFYQIGRSLKLKSKEISYRQLKSAITSPKHLITQYLERLQNNHSLYLERKKNIDDELNSLKQNYKDEFLSLKRKIENEVNKRIDNSTARLYDFKFNHEKEKYIEENIFRIKEIQVQFEQFLDYWRQFIQDEAEEIQGNVLFKEYEYIDEDLIFSIMNESEDMYPANIRGEVEFYQPSVKKDIPYVTDTSGMHYFLTDLFGSGFGGVLSDIGKGIVKFFTIGGVQDKLRHQFRSHLETSFKEIERRLNEQLEYSRAFLCNSMDQSFSFLYSSFEESLEIQKLLQEFFDDLTQMYQSPNLKEVLRTEKDQLQLDLQSLKRLQSLITI